MSETGVPSEQWHRIHPPPRLSAPRLVRPTRIDPSGLTGPTRSQSRGPRWRRTGVGLFLPTTVQGDQPAQRILEATGLLPGACAVTGWASLHLAGARWFEGVDERNRELPVQLRVGPRRRAARSPGISVDRRRVLPGEVVQRHGIVCLNVHRSLFDEVVRRSDLRAAVVAIEMVFFAELTTRRRFDAWLATLPRTPGLPLVRAALALAGEGAASPPETLLRLAWESDARLPPPLCNVEVYSERGHFLGRPDLILPELAVVGEYNGAHHLQVREHSRDLIRVDTFRDHGLEVATVVGGELRRTELVVERLLAAVRRAQRSTTEPRWVLHGPAGPPPDLEARFASQVRRLGRKRGAAVLADAPTRALAPAFDVRPGS